MNHMFRTYLGKFGETCLRNCSFPWSNHCNTTKASLNPSMPWSWVCPPGHQQRLPWFHRVAHSSCSRCVTRTQCPSHSLSVVLPNLDWTPRLRKAPCRDRGRTCCRQSIHHVQRNIFAETGVAELRKNNQDRITHGFSAISLTSSDNSPSILKQWFTDNLQEQSDELFVGWQDLSLFWIQCLSMLSPYLGQFIWVWCFPT